MNLPLLIGLVAACVVLFILERRGLPTTLELHFKGDIKRETRWLAQYGQSVCTPVAALLVWQMDTSNGPWKALKIIIAVLSASITCMILKRLLGRVRPGRENAGKFLGPSLKHSNARESFPSSHSACAVALSTALVILYPSGAAVFWGLAIACAVLRYLLDAHWPSDVLGGSALGYAMAWTLMTALPK
jgi:membrane-associated phospholipid phosphatase